jgi:hypothetical protein
MFMRVGEWLSDLTGAWLPAWGIPLAAVLAVVVCAIACIRGGPGGKRELVLRASLVVVALAACWMVLDHSARRNLADERQALDARAFELASRALLPGSPLACLAGPMGEMVEEACEKILFASPEASAAAVSYVAAQLSLLADARDHARRGGSNYGNALTSLRRVIEADRFGIVAHVLAVRDGCMPDQCAAFGFLQGTGRVNANLAKRPFEAHLKSHIADWQAADGRPVVSNPSAAAGAPVAVAKPPSTVYFPSSASIPSVNIMAAEPSPPQQSRDAAGTSEPAAPPRRPASGSSPGRQSPRSNNGTTGAAPLQLMPNAQ